MFPESFENLKEKIDSEREMQDDPDSIVGRVYHAPVGSTEQLQQKELEQVNLHLIEGIVYPRESYES